MHEPTSVRYQAVKQILRYVRGSMDYGIHIFSQLSFILYRFSDADWTGCPLTRRSTTGYCIYLGSNCISWAAKTQPTVSKSSAEAKYRSMATTTAEITWLTYLLRDIGIRLERPSVLFCENIGALCMTVKPVFHARTKYIKIDYHFVHQRVTLGVLVTRFVPSSHQHADIFTKGAFGNTVKFTVTMYFIMDIIFSYP